MKINEDNEVLTTYDILVNQQKQINEHDKKIAFIRYCCIWMTILITTLSIALFIVMIKTK